ncbi:hypothetical protein ACSQ67_021216 [Phaseolus vulgaris]
MQALRFDCTIQVPRFSSTTTPPNFASFLPTLSPSKAGTRLCLTFGCGLYKPLRKTRWDGFGVQCATSNGESGDGFYIRRCVELARKAVGYTSPNPLVGCVIVKDGVVVGEGYHPRAGQPHAEVFALRDAGDLAQSATAYVSLEPCNHFGRTPPCTEALIKAKVKKVVVGMVDPNPIVAFKGVERLRDAGIEVVVGVEEELCKSLNEPYIHRMLTGKPLLTLRYSLSVNGNFLDLLGNGVTDCGGYYSRLLQEYDAVIISSSFFTENFKVPSSQEPGANQPILIITHKDPNSLNQIPPSINDITGKMIIFTENKAGAAPEVSLQGIETVALDQINLDVIMDYCNRQGLCSALLDIRGVSVSLKSLSSTGIEELRARSESAKFEVQGL